LNNKEENSKDFCLDFVQEFGLRSLISATVQKREYIFMGGGKVVT
jgi:hypothetical protein